MIATACDPMCEEVGVTAAKVYRVTGSALALGFVERRGSQNGPKGDAVPAETGRQRHD